MSRVKFIRVSVKNETPENVEEKQVDLCEIVREGYIEQIMPEGQEDRLIMVSTISGIVR